MVTALVTVGEPTKALNAPPEEPCRMGARGGRGGIGTCSFDGMSARIFVPFSGAIDRLRCNESLDVIVGEHRFS